MAAKGSGVGIEVGTKRWPHTGRSSIVGIKTQRTRIFALDVNADAVAYATLKYAMSTEDVNGARPKGNFKNRKVLVPFSQSTE